MSELNAPFTKASQGYGRDFRELLREWKLRRQVHCFSFESLASPLEDGCLAHTLSCRCRHNPTRG
jgi:hypothetical protein